MRRRNFLRFLGTGMAAATLTPGQLIAEVSRSVQIVADITLAGTLFYAPLPLTPGQTYDIFLDRGVIIYDGTRWSRYSAKPLSLNLTH